MHLPTRISEPGRITDLSYDDDGNLLSRTVTDTETGESRTTTYNYTGLGLVESVDGPRTDVNDVTSYSYDGQGNLIQITNALGQVTQITSHDAHGNPLRTVDANGVETALSYDARQRLISRSVAGAVTTFDYDGVGQLTQVTLPNGASLTYTYDAAHRLTGIEDNLGNRIAYTLDAMGNRITEEVFDPAGTLKRSQSQVFDALSRLKEVHGANGQLTEYQYDANGNRTSTTEAGLYSTLNQFDALDRLTQVTDPNSGETTYTYDALDRLTSVTDAEGLTTTYRYNAFGDLIEQDSPDTGASTYAYDKAGNRISETDARNITVSHHYDALNRLTLADYPGTTEDITYHYDGTNYSASIPNGIGRLTGIDDQSGSTAFTYDARGNLIADERTINGQSFTTSYQYDAADNLMGMTYPSGRQVNLTRDAVGRITAIDSDEGTIASAIAYLPFGPITHMTLGNGIHVGRAFDLDYRLTALTDSTLRDKRYSYDPRNQISDLEDLMNTGKSQSFTYDALGRLTDAQGSYGQIGYSYDAIGNRTSKTDNGITQNNTYDPNSHRLLQAGTTTYSYDAAGNTTARGSQQYSYNQAGRLTHVPGASYGYNALGQRVTKTAPDELGNNQTTRFHYNPQGQLIAETDNEGNTVREYLYLDNLPIAMQTRPKGALDDTLDQTPVVGPILGGLLDSLQPGLPDNDLTPAPKLYYLHPDHLGTPQMATDQAGNIAWSVDYQPFGEVTITNDTINNPLRFPGQYADPETGLYYNYFRDYDPEIGRYIQSDPIGLRGGINTYGYVLGDPINNLDPFGLFKICRRPLSFMGDSMTSGQSGTNLGLYHQHGFYEDGTGDNTGYTTTGLFDDRANASKYQCESKSYDDGIMRQAQQNIGGDWPGDGYNAVTNNCQDYMDALVDEYNDIKDPPTCRMTSRGLRCN